SREREGACQNKKYKIGMPRKWNEVVLGEGRDMPKREINTDEKLIFKKSSIYTERILEDVESKRRMK
ncbi:hypothetical protein, partial [Eubacterium xylanophilum]|uniref:hypothetical protein n=1 Tax=Eubacterium xylanophilum TaxID=39497 RepID=UPI00146F98A9